MIRQAHKNRDSPHQTACAEQELLLCCARSQMDASNAARIKSLVREDLDWDYLLRIAERHSLLPLLYWQLDANVAGEVPPAYATRLKERFRANAARNLFLTGELCHLLRSFESEGVAAVPYKGPALAVSAYGNLALRCFVDLDVLVRKRDVLRAKEILIAKGYRPQPYLTDSQQAVMLRTQHNLPFVRDGKIIVELHWEVAAKKFTGTLEVGHMWEQLETVSLSSGTFKYLSVEDSLLSLCIHGSKHLWERLAWICDVAELLKSFPTLDWKRVNAQASGSGNERMLFLGLRLADELIGAILPEDVGAEVYADASVARLAADVRAHLFIERAASPPGVARSMFFNLRARRRLRDKIGYFRFVFMPTDGDLVVLRLPAPLTFVYYVLRPFRMLLKSHSKHQFRSSQGQGRGDAPPAA